MNYKPHPRLESVLDKVREHKEPYEVNVLGKKIIVFPGVLSPRYDPSSHFYIECLPNQKNKTVLEIGSGSGVLSLFVALQGASQVVAVDINPNAVENTKENFRRYNVQDFQAFYSNLFENVEGKFDTIIFAAPYYGNKPNDILERAVSDDNYKTLELFLKNAKNFLNLKGQIYLGFSDTGDTDLLKKLIIENQYLIRDFKEKAFIDWKAELYVLELL